MRKAMHPTAILAPSQLFVSVLCVDEQIIARPQRYDRVYARVKALDLIQIRGHHLDTGNLPRLDRVSQFDGIQGDDFFHWLALKCCGRQGGAHPTHCAQELRSSERAEYRPRTQSEPK